jgi:hypothetical protein
MLADRQRPAVDENPRDFRQERGLIDDLAENGHHEDDVERRPDEWQRCAVCRNAGRGSHLAALDARPHLHQHLRLDVDRDEARAPTRDRPGVKARSRSNLEDALRPPQS